MLSGVLDRCARDRARLLELLALGDEQLIAAVAGKRASALRDAYERFAPGALEGKHRQERTICRHDRGYPRTLIARASPHMLAELGDSGRLARLSAAPTVAIVGSSSPSDYGRETARGLARGLAASGVTVVAGLAGGIAAAALAGVLDAGAGAIAVRGDGLGVSCSPRLRPLYKRVMQDGCAISELPWGCDGRRWGQLASARIVVGLGLLSVVVEARETPEELAAAALAKALGRVVAAIPGRVSSPLSRGAHALLMDGASLARGPRDVLELIYAHGGASVAADAARPAALRRCDHAHARSAMHPTLSAVLEHVGAGYDTPDRLIRVGVSAREVLPALSELELEGLLVRGDGGRYLPRDPLDW